MALQGFEVSDLVFSFVHCISDAVGKRCSNAGWNNENGELHYRSLTFMITVAYKIDMPLSQ